MVVPPMGRTAAGGGATENFPGIWPRRLREGVGGRRPTEVQPCGVGQADFPVGGAIDREVGTCSVQQDVRKTVIKETLRP